MLSLTVPNNTVKSFSEANDSSSSRFQFMIVTAYRKYSKNYV